MAAAAGHHPTADNGSVNLVPHAGQLTPEEAGPGSVGLEEGGIHPGDLEHNSVVVDEGGGLAVLGQRVRAGRCVQLEREAHDGRHPRRVGKQWCRAGVGGHRPHAAPGVSASSPEFTRLRRAESGEVSS
ncbi:MAG: hypothetical protein LC808_05090, partial [Actinobacteria bacterium]|nr:hypothetical protein [Actinomycetota bacterium]